MKIEIVYRDLYESSGQLFIKQMTNEFNYCLLGYGDVMRKHLSNETDLGKQIKAYIDKGELIPDELTFEAIKYELIELDCENILLKSYPKNKEQVKLFIEYCSNMNIKLKRAWYMKGLNIMSNLEKVPKYSQMAAKYKSHEHQTKFRKK